MCSSDLATLLLSLLGVNGQLELQSFLKDCLNEGKDLNTCLVEMAEKLRPFMKTGIPELNIPQTEPMVIEKIGFQLKSPLGTVDTEFTKNSVAGLSDHEVRKVEADKQARTLAVEIFIPRAQATGLYHMAGTLGPLELDETLPPAAYTSTFTGVLVSGVAKLAEQNGKLVIVGDPEVEVNVNGLNVQMDNLFGGSANGLAKVVLKFVNKESDKFVKDFQPEIAKQVASLIKGFFNSALKNIPLSTFQ